MALDRSAAHAKPAIERRPALASTIQRSAAAGPSPAQALRQRLGNQAAQALVMRAAADATPKATRLANVSSPHDPAEREAEETSRKVMRMQDPKPEAAKATGTASGIVQREAANEPSKAVVSASPAPEGAAGPGVPLPMPVRRFMEPRFGASFENVRVHTGEGPAQQSAELGAHAFTVGGHVFFGRGKYQPDTASGQELLAHELTHTVQQGATVQHPAAVQRSADTTITQRSEPRIQRSVFSEIIDWVAGKANAIPGFRLLTLVLGVNPVNMSPVERSAANMVRAVLELVPVTGPLLVAALDSYHLIDKAGAWIEAKVRAFGVAGKAIWEAVKQFVGSLGLSDIAPWNAGDTWDRAVRIFTDPIQKIASVASTAISEFVGFVREAIVIPLAKLAEGTRGWDLLCAVLGENPITREKVKPTPEMLIGGFMKLIGEEEVWENVKKANAIPRAWAWFQAALAALVGFVRQIPKLFVDTLHSIDLKDLLSPFGAFEKVAVAFGGFALKFISWAGDAVWKLLELIFEVVSPATLAYLKKTGAALKSILKNPMPFMHNLVNAAKLGIQNFADNFVTHLKAGLIEWLVGALPGVYIPKEFSLKEMVMFVFSVLGISWANIRKKLVAVVGETAVKAMEVGFDIVVTLVTQGPAAAWDKIKEELANLKDMVIGGIVDMVVDAIVKKAIPKLVSMFIPGAGFISAIITIYDTIMVFVQKLARMAAVVKSFVDSIVNIAEGKIDDAAKRVENALAGVLALLISILAGLFGLGNVADKVMGVIKKVQDMVDKGIDALIAWIVKMAKALFAKGKAAVKALVGWWKSKFQFQVGAERHSLQFEGEEGSAKLMVASDAKPVRAFIDEKRDEAKGDKDKAKAITDVEALLAQVEKMIADDAKVAEKDKKPGDEEKMQKDVEKLMNQMSAPIIVLLTTDDWGSQQNPAPLEYQKRRADAYPTFYLATGTLTALSQADMAKQFASQKANAKDKVYQYRPTQQQPVPPGASGTLGLGAASQIDVGHKIEFSGKETRGGGVPRFKELVGKFGFVASTMGWDIDHVIELQVGGKDQFDNMWPLPSGENRSSGSIIKNSTVKPPKRAEMKVQEALDAKVKEKPPAGKQVAKSVWLIIVSTRQL